MVGVWVLVGVLVVVCVCVGFAADYVSGLW